MVENQTIEEYIIARRQAGVTDNTIQSELLANGWNIETISAAFTQPNLQVSTQTSRSDTTSIANNKMLLPIGVVAIVLVIATAFGWYFFQNNPNTSTSESGQAVPTPIATTNPENSSDQDEIDDSYESLTREESANKFPYVAAASDVEQIINAVNRYKAFQGTYPETLQDMANEGELTQEFIDRKQAAYTLTFSATNEDDCKVVATFSDGRIITSMCKDPNYHDQFTEFYRIEQ